MRLISPCAISLGLIVLTAGVAGADDQEAVRVVDVEDQANKDVPFRRIDISLVAELNLADNLAGDPISIAPDAWIRFEKLRFGIVHSSLGITGFHGIGVGSALCIHGDACDMSSPSIYHGGGIQAEARLVEAKTFDLFVGGGPVITGLDPFGIGLKLGAKMMGTLGDSWAVFELEPNALVALRHRDTVPDRLNIPFRLSAATLVGLETGITAPLDGFGDGWRVPLGVFGHYPVTDHLLAKVAFTFPAVAGGDAVPLTGADDRVLTVGVEYIDTTED